MKLPFWICIVFTVPMRNWNKSIERIQGIKTVSFYSTYEELKHPSGSSVAPSGNRFYSTYEELKQFEEVKATDIPKGFYSTYEELKHRACKVGTHLLKCFYSTYEELKHTSDPDDGPYLFCFYSTYEELKHIWCYWISTLKNSFLQYLWGIETEFHFLSRCSQ